MKGLSEIDDGYYDELGPQDKDDFEKLFKKKSKSIDEERARESYERSFEAKHEQEYRLFRDVVNAFSTDQAGFEATIVNPLYEFGDTNSEVLLAKSQANSVHLCFVSCEVGGQDYAEWTNCVNELDELARDNEAMASLKKHIHCQSLNLGSIQYVTITRDVDIPDINVEVLRTGTDPDFYAIWKLLREPEFNEDTEDMEEAKTIKYHDGRMAVPDFKTVCESGIDPLSAENDDIKYSLSSHSVFSLGEVCFDLYLNKLGSDDHPKEFNESEFKSSYLDNVYFGNEREAMEAIAGNRIDSLLEFGLEHGILKDDPDLVEERDYKIMWGSEDPADIKSMVRRKFIDSKVPEEKREIAYSRAKEEFEEGEHTLDDFNAD